LSENYQHLNWPIVPLDLCASVIEYSKTAQNLGKFLNSSMERYHQYEALLELTDWCKQNLPIDDSYFIRIQKMFNIDRLENHVDVVRDSVVNYLLSPSGPETRWYDRNENVIESVVFTQYQWFKLSTNVTHSVENISFPRIAISVFQKNKIIRIPYWAKK
jgi:hypothetical protein